MSKKIVKPKETEVVKPKETIVQFLCKSCMKQVANQRICPYAAEIFDEEKLCTCCDHCRKQCADEV